MTKVRNYIISGEEDTVDYCHYYVSDDGRYKFAIIDIPEPHICALEIDGVEEFDYDSKAAAKKIAWSVNEYYGDKVYEGRDDIRIIEEALEPISCLDCPWFWRCDAMDTEVD